MKNLIITTRTALLLNERELVNENVKYQINTSTFKKNDKTILAEMSVDAYIDGQWDPNLSRCYQLGDKLDFDCDEWLALI